MGPDLGLHIMLSVFEKQSPLAEIGVQHKNWWYDKGLLFTCKIKELFLRVREKTFQNNDHLSLYKVKDQN